MVGFGSENRGIDSVGRITVLWRILHMMVCQYGSHPTGQFLIAFTMNILHERGYSPTINELCRVTGLPISSASRYVSWQISNGYVKEIIDPNDRRKRLLEQTAKGKTEMRQLVRHLDELFDFVANMTAELVSKQAGHTPEHIMARMEELTKAAGKHRD